jgi:hypothetical protein
MSKELINELFTKMLYCELSNDENRIIHEAIDQDKNLETEYLRYVKLKNELQSLAEKDLFEEKDLLESRNELFAKIERNSGFKSFSYLSLSIAAGLLVLVSFTGGFFWAKNMNTSNTQNKIEFPEGDIISLEIEELDDNQIAIKGKTLNEFHLVKNINEKDAKQLLEQSLVHNQSIPERIKALEILKNNDKNQEFVKTLMDVIVKEKNLNIRLEAIKSLKHYSWNKDMEEFLSQVLLTDKNASIRLAILNLFQEFQKKEELRTLLEINAQTNKDKDLQLKIYSKLMELNHE